MKQQKVSVCALACACVLSLSVGAYADIIDSSSAVPRFAETASTFSGVTPATGTWAGTNDVAYVESDTIFFDIDSVESTVSFTPTSAALEDAKMEVCVVSGVTCSSVCTDDDLAGFATTFSDAKSAVSIVEPTAGNYRFACYSPVAIDGVHWVTNASFEVTLGASYDIKIGISSNVTDICSARVYYFAKSSSGSSYTAIGDFAASSSGISSVHFAGVGAIDSVSGSSADHIVSFTGASGDMPTPLAFCSSANALSLPSPSGLAAGNAFTGWTVPGLAGAKTSLPAGFAADAALIASYETVFPEDVTVDVDGSSVPVNVPVSWLADNMTGYDGETTASDVETFLETTAANGLKNWQNAVLGVSSSEAVSVTNVRTAASVDLSLGCSIPAPAKNLGIEVFYSLDKVSAAGSVVQRGVSRSDSPDIVLSMGEGDPTGYYSVSIGFTADGNSEYGESSTTIGVVKSDFGAGSEKVALSVPWKSLQGGGNIAVVDLVRTANLAAGDKLYVYDQANSRYLMWALDDEKAWQPTATYAIDENGSMSAISSGEPESSTVPRGSAVWLERGVTSRSAPVYLCGKHDATTPVVSSIAAAAGGKPSWNLVAAPAAEDVNINTKITSATNGDVIVVPSAGAPVTYERRNGSWGRNVTTSTYNSRLGRNVTTTAFSTEGCVIPRGTGFWYKNSGAAKNIEW